MSINDGPPLLASPEDVADALAHALTHAGRRRTHDAGELMAAIVAREFVDVLSAGIGSA